MKLASAAAAVAALLLAGSVSATARAAPSPGAYRETARARTTVRFIYTESSAAVGNAMLAFRAAWDGSPRPAGTFATAGTGTGTGLGPRGALAADGRYLVAVNAGSNTVTAFAARRDGSWSRRMAT